MTIDHGAGRPVCLITGGSSGIGLATAKHFASQGFDILIAARDPDRLADAESQLGLMGVQCRAVSIDLDTDAARAGELVDVAVEQFGRLDVLVNNAATAPLSPLEDLSASDFETAINLNHRAVFYLTQAAWRQMLQQAFGGVIVNVSSLAAVDPFPGFSVYGASKAWIDLLTTALAAEGKEQTIRVYSVRPGAVETPLLRSLFPDFPTEQTVSPEQVAEKIWYVYSDCPGKLSGQALPVSN